MGDIVSTSNLVAALGRMQRKPTSRLDLALAREIAVREGIKAIVIGSVSSAGTGYIITTLPALLGRAYDQANVADSTIANLERYLTIPSPGRVEVDAWMLGPAHKRLGELYEARNDNTRAVSHYTAFVNLWKRADPDLQGKVAEVRTRLDRLQRTLSR